MSDNTILNAGTGGDVIATDDIGGVKFQRVKVTFGADGTATDASDASPLPVSLGLTDAQLRAAAVPISGTVAISGTVPVSGTFFQATQPVSLTSLPALATGANVIGGVTQSGTWTVGVSGSVAVTGTFWPATQPVSGTITANAGSGTFAISAASLPLPAGAATSAKQDVLAGLLPASIGQKAKAGALAVTLASDEDLLTANSEYETVAASQSDQALGATGGSGDFISHLLIVPATTSPGAVSIKDGAGSAITVFAGGASSVTSLVPFTVVLNMKSLSGAWKVTTGANVSAIGVGNFT